MPLLQPAARGNEAQQQGVSTLHAPLAADYIWLQTQKWWPAWVAVKEAEEAAAAAAATAKRPQTRNFSDLPATDALALLHLQHPNAGSATVLISPGVDVIWHPAAIEQGVVPTTFLRTMPCSSVTGQAMSILAVDGAAQVDALMEKGVSPAACSAAKHSP